MSESIEVPLERPWTGHAATDAVLDQVDVSPAPVAEVLRRLTRAHEGLHQVLTDADQATLPREESAR